jgi:hypothetical protein
VNFLSKFLHKKKPAPSGGVPSHATNAAVTAARDGTTIHGHPISAPEAERIETEKVADWCNRLEREANRTGNARLLSQANNIRRRFGIA